MSSSPVSSLAVLVAALAAVSPAPAGPSDTARFRITQRALVVQCLDGRDAGRAREWALAPGAHAMTVTVGGAADAGAARVRFDAVAGHRYELEVRAPVASYAGRAWRKSEWRPVVRDRGRAGRDDGPVVLVGSEPEWLEPGAACTAPPPAGAASLDAQPVAFPAYAAYKGIERYAPTPADYAAAQEDSRFVLERLAYDSDGLRVFAYLYRPRTPAPGARLPVVIFNRGSYVRDDFSPEVLMPAHRLAQQGYLVIAPMYRGSGGAPGHDEMGGADLHDLFNLLPVLQLLPYADPGRLFLYGESRGAIMALLAAKSRFPARAIAIYGAITDMGAFFAANPGARAIGPQVWPGFPANEEEVVASRSAVRWAEQIDVPVLIMNGGADRDVSPTNALQLALALEKLQKPYELKIFYGEQHVLAGRAAERDDDAVRWFRRFES